MSNKIIKDAKLNTSSEKHEPKRLQQTTGAGVNFSAKAVLIVIGIVVVIFACAYVGYEQMKPVVAFTVDGEKVTLADMGYYIYEGEQQGNSMASIYQSVYGADYDYWNSQDENGNTPADSLSSTVIEDAKQTILLYKEAVKKGYSATDDDKKSATKERDEIVKNLGAKQKMKTGLSSEDLYQSILKKTVAERYKKDLIKSLNVDYKKATKDITKKDYKQYDFQYYYVETAETDENGESKELSDAEKKELKKKMDELAKKAETAKDFAKLLGDDEKTIQFQESGQILEKDEEVLDKKVDAAIKKLKVNEISGVLEGESGYYLVKLTDNTSTKSYDDAISEAKSNADNEAFNKEYTNNIEPNYKVSVNDDDWDAIKLGNYCS